MRMTATLLAAVLALTACGGNSLYQEERFAAQSRFRIELPASAARVCEAARRALLGQGYVVARATPEDGLALIGSKEFMDDRDKPSVLQVHATCVEAGSGATLYASAVESHFRVAESKQKTSVGIPVVAPLTVSSTTISETALKISGETLQDDGFYQRLFAAVARELGLER